MDTLSNRVENAVENILAVEVEKQLEQYARNIILPKLMGKFKSQFQTMITADPRIPKDFTITVRFLSDHDKNPDPIVHRS